MFAKSNYTLPLAVAASVLSLASTSRAAITSIGFGEVELANRTALADTTYYESFGISFTGGATYLMDPRLVNVGGDNIGITTGINDPVMGVVFTQPASSVTFSGLSVNTDFYATVFDENGDELDTILFPQVVGENYFTHTFSGVGDIKAIEFHDHNLFIGVGQLSFTVVPEPTSLSLLGLGAMSLLTRARRR